MDNLQEWIVPILTSIVAIAVAIMTCKWQMRTELRKILESYVSDKKYKAYYDAVNIVFTLLEEGRQNKIVSSNDRFHELLKVKQDLFVVLMMRLDPLQNIFAHVLQIQMVVMSLSLCLISC